MEIILKNEGEYKRQYIQVVDAAGRHVAGFHVALLASGDVQIFIPVEVERNFIIDAEKKIAIVK